MKTKVTYRKNANWAKAMLIAGLILCHAALNAGDSAKVNNSIPQGIKASINYLEASRALNVKTAYSDLNEVAFEAEYEIEEWMCDVNNDFWNTSYDNEEIELEEWMFNIHHSFWNEFYFEEELAIESWMTEPDEWLHEPNSLSMNTY